MLEVVSLGEDSIDDLNRQQILIGQNQHFNIPTNKMIKEMLNPDTNSLIKSELTEAEIVPYTVASSFEMIVDCPYHRMVLDNFTKARMSKNRLRVKELIGMINPSRVNKPDGFFKRLFGGRGGKE